MNTENKETEIEQCDRNSIFLIEKGWIDPMEYHGA